VVISVMLIVSVTYATYESHINANLITALHSQ